MFRCSSDLWWSAVVSLIILTSPKSTNAMLQSIQISVMSAQQPRNFSIEAVGHMAPDPQIPDGSLVGVLVGSKPVNGCVELERPPAISDPLFSSESIILLVQRGNCNISTKITQAYAAGYDALIVFDSVADGDLLNAVPFNVDRNASMPVLFVSYLDGRLLWRRFQYFTGSYVIATAHSNASFVTSTNKQVATGSDARADITNALLGFIPTVSYVCVVALIIIIFLTRRFLHCSLFVVYKLVTGNSKMAPLFKAKVTDSTMQITDSAPCCICLENFRAEDQIHAILPCKHIFHQSCIDRWLRSGKLACPLCRRKITLRRIIQQVFTSHHIVSPLTSVKVNTPLSNPSRWACPSVTPAC